MIDFDSPYSLLINGQPARTSAQLDVINPATGAVFAHCPAAGAEQLDAAVSAARAAFPAWRALGFAQRAIYIEKCAGALTAHREALARLREGLRGRAQPTNAPTSRCPTARWT